MTPLTELESIRRRPGMYIGNVHDGSGLVHLIWEVVANSLDEHLAGHCKTISVIIEPDGSIVIEDDGRGIRVDDVGGIPFAQLALTAFHATPTLDGHAPHEHVGLRGVGIFVVNALSTRLQLDSFHRGRHYAQRYERGVATSSLEDLGPTQRSGTRIHFLPDPTIFSDMWINPGTVAARLRELTCLLPSLTLSFSDRREHRFHEPRGLRAFLQRTRASEEIPDADIFIVQARHDEIGVEAAMEWRAHLWSATIESFANIERTTEGGSHVRGLLNGLVDGLRAFAGPQARDHKRAQVRNALERGLSAVVCVRLHDPTYGAPTKDRLETPEAERAVRAVVAPAFTTFLTQHPSIAERLVQAVAAGEDG